MVYATDKRFYFAIPQTKPVFNWQLSYFFSNQAVPDSSAKLPTPVFACGPKTKKALHSALPAEPF
jgi:hypothetical protein